MGTIFKIMCGGIKSNGGLINRHSDGGRYYGWNNPIDFIPPIGSIIEHITLHGEITQYKVISIKFSMQEDVNHSYQNKVCIIEVSQIF